MTPPTCSSCPFFAAGNDDYGQCRRQAPRGYSYSLSGWARVKNTDWCGEHPEFMAKFFPNWLSWKITQEQAQTTIASFTPEQNAPGDAGA